MAQSPHQPGPIVHRSRVAPASVDLADAVAQGVRAGFGVLSLGLEVVLRTLGESPAAALRKPGPRMPVSDVVDHMVGTAWGLARLSGRLAFVGARITAPVLDLALRPPLVPRRLQPDYTLQLMTERWQRDRPQTLAELERLSTTALPRAVDAALAQVDMERLVTAVLDRVDLTKVTTDVLGRLDVDQVAAQLLSQLDVDDVAAQLLGQLDVDDVADQLLGQLDLTQLVLDRVDLGRVVSGALERLDLTAIVLDQVDLGEVVSAALQQVDLTEIVTRQVDLGDVVSVALQQVDLTEIVMRQVDLIGVAEYVVEGIDLPEIIRDSTGSVASEAVVGLRMQGIDADLVVGRVVDKMLRRRRHRRTEEVPGQLSSPDSLPDPPAGKPA